MDYLIQRRVDGLLVWMGRAPSSYPCLAPTAGPRLPYVSLGRYLPDPAASFIGVDRGAGMEQAVEHLTRMGITRIGYVGSDIVEEVPAGAFGKYAGFFTALKRRGLEPAARIRPRWERFVPDGTREAGHEIGRALAADGARPRAMLCEGDPVALGMIAGLCDGGLRVPQDVAVIGFDGIAEGQFSRPRLTTIAHPLDRLVEIGLNALLRQIEDSDAPTEHLMLEPQLIVRESCGAGPSGGV
jgi:DNA-binding LacI/PurR family transcriptional regulator